jgi:hypothetical protein
MQHDNIAVGSPEDLYVTARRNGLIAGSDVGGLVGAGPLSAFNCYPSSNSITPPYLAPLINTASFLRARTQWQLSRTHLPPSHVDRWRWRCLETSLCAWQSVVWCSLEISYLCAAPKVTIQGAVILHVIQVILILKYSFSVPRLEAANCRCGGLCLCSSSTDTRRQRRQFR